MEDGINTMRCGQCDRLYDITQEPYHGYECMQGITYPEGMISIPCPPPIENAVDLTIITKQLTVHADELMKELTEHADLMKKRIVSYALQVREENKNWVAVEERVPPNNHRVLLVNRYYKDGFMFIDTGFRLNGDWYDDNDEKVNDKSCSVSHWMALPDKPKKS